MVKSLVSSTSPSPFSVFPLPLLILSFRLLLQVLTSSTGLYYVLRYRNLLVAREILYHDYLALGHVACRLTVYMVS